MAPLLCSHANNGGAAYIIFTEEDSAVSQITKRALEQSLKNLLLQKPITKITINDMGAATVLMAAGLDLPSNIHGIIADCGFTSPHAIWKHVANNNLHIAFGLRGAIADEMLKQKIQMGSDEYSTVEALQSSTIPVMLIHGTDDHFVPVEMTYENYKACAGPKRLLIVPGADHGMSYFVKKDRYEEEIKRFWRDFD